MSQTSIGKSRCWHDAAAALSHLLAFGGDLTVVPADIDVWDRAARHDGTQVSEPERKAFARLPEWGHVDTYRQQHPDRRPTPGRTVVPATSRRTAA